MIEKLLLLFAIVFNGQGQQNKVMPCENGAIRLQGGLTGDSDTTGRVEICSNSTWGTICDSAWGDMDAQVACVQLGFVAQGSRAIFDGFERGSFNQPIWLRSVGCAGTETSLFRCTATRNSLFCDHSDDAGVICSGVITINNTRATNFNGQLTFECTAVGTPDARFLGWETASSGQNATGEILVNVERRANDEVTFTRLHPSDLQTCLQDGGYRCVFDNGNQSNIVKSPLLECEDLVCRQGGIRLRGGRDNRTGRVEICHENAWGTVCDSAWGDRDAEVACRQLGFVAQGAQAIFDGFERGSFDQPIWLRSVGCVGTETSLFRCTATRNSFFCDHADDAGVICSGVITINDTRATNFNGLLTFECTAVGTPDARFLGWEAASSGQNATGEILVNVERRANDVVTFTRLHPSDLQTCIQDGGYRCIFDNGNQSDIAKSPLLECEDLICLQGGIRLRGGRDNRTGRVEICHENAWGTVCDSAWGDRDAEVACRQLGFVAQGAQAIFSGFERGSIDQPIWLRSVGCVGSETSLFICSATRNSLFCDHADDAGVICNGVITINNTRATNFNGQLTFECTAVGTPDARFLGWETASSEQNATGEILVNVERRANDEVTFTRLHPSDLESCLQDGGYRCVFDNGNRSNIVKSPLLECEDLVCQQGDIRLQGGRDNTTGRVEICHENAWGTVCDSSWGDRDAEVACRQLGFVAQGAQAIFDGFNRGSFGQPIWLRSVGCVGTETSLFSCSATRNSLFCDHFNDAGVSCSGVITINQTQATNVNGQLIFECTAVGTPDARFLGWETASSGENATGEILVNTVKRTSDVVIFTRLKAKNLDTCRLDDGYTCIFDNGNPFNVIRTSLQKCEQFVCQQGDVRLMGGANSTTGRVEICNANAWGSICEDSWEAVDAGVVCRQLGFVAQDAHAIFSGFEDGIFGQPIWLRFVGCAGTETFLSSCSASKDTKFCDHSEDAGVICSGGCAVGTYFSLSSQDCRSCPMQSVGEESGLSECPCLEGYYRAPGEQDLPCTQPPSEPRNLAVTSITSTSITLSWDPPESEGGRNDTQYILWYQEEGTFHRVKAGTVNATIGTVTGLRPDTHYIVLVSAVNGVSNLSMEDPVLNAALTRPLGTSRLPKSSSVGKAIGASLGVILGIAAAVITIIVASVYFGIKRKRLHDKKYTEELLAKTAFALTKKTLKHYEIQMPFENTDIPRSLILTSRNLKLKDAIGQGEFGIVYRGLLKTGHVTETVAVKTLKGFYITEKKQTQDLLKECMQMYEFDHPNVLTLVGVCLDGGPAPYVVMPFMANGSLQAYLKGRKNKFVLNAESEEIVKVRKKLSDFCFQVAKGMEYLASKRVIHRDLAARNCMVDMNCMIKVADFGLSECIETSKLYFRQDQKEGIKLPIKWLAPESITDAIFSQKSDVWSFGVTCWEIFTGGNTPYPGVQPTNLPRQLDNGLRMEKPLNAACNEKIYTMMTMCWNSDPALRPTFGELVLQISSELADMAGYCALNSAHSEHQESDYIN